MLAETNLSRKLGIVEQNLTARRLNNFYNNFTFIGKYNNVLTIPVIYSVIKKMLLKYSMLTCNYCSSTNEISPIRNIRLGDILEILQRPSPIKYDNLLNEIDEYVFDLDCEKPLFKLLLINGSVLVVIFEHSIFDGGSGFNFHKIFLEQLNSLSGEEFLSDIGLDSILFDLDKDLDEIESLPLAADEYLNFTPDIEFLAKKKLKDVLPKYLKYWINDHNYTTIPNDDLGVQLQKWGGINASLNFKTYFKLIQFSEDQTKKILSACRKRNITITAFLEIFSLQLLVQFKAIDDTEEKGCYINSMIPVNLRRFLQDDIKKKCEFGIYLNPGNINNIEINKLKLSYGDVDEFWNLCSHSCSLIKNNSTDVKVIMNYFNSFASSYNRDSPSEMKNKLFQNFEKSNGVNTRLSNLGVFINNQPQGLYKVDDLIFNQSIGVNGGSVVFNVVSTKLSGMNITFSCLHGIFSSWNEVENYCSSYKDKILELIEED